MTKLPSFQNRKVRISMLQHNSLSEQHQNQLSLIFSSLKLSQLQLLSLKVVGRFEKLTSAQRIRVFIVDDSVMDRERSKKVELLARVFDHVSGRFVRGYNLLTLGWSDGYSFAPLDFTLMSSAKANNRLCEMREDLDKRSVG